MLRVLLLLFLIPHVVSATNAGIVQGLWYDQETVFVDQTTRIYVAIRNNTGADLTGTVEFYVNEKRLERAAVAALDGRIVESWTDWSPEYGTSTVVAKLTRTEISSAAGSATTIEPLATLAEDIVFVDYDTDGDGVGNQQDNDDDGDGVSDSDEVIAGTDSLQYDELTDDGDEVADRENTDGSPAGSGSEAPTAGRTNADSFQSAGLEQFLTPSRADTLLQSVTNVIQTTKEKVDAHREARATQKADAETVTVNRDGFGEIQRSSAQGRSQLETEQMSGAEKMMHDLVTLLKKILSEVYTFLLYLVSFTLNYPMLLQIVLLLLILFLVYTLARRLGRRPK